MSSAAGLTATDFTRAPGALAGAISAHVLSASLVRTWLSCASMAKKDAHETLVNL